MFYGSYVLNGEKHAAIYDSYDLFNRDTFSPLCEKITVIPFETHGKSYADRRESVRETAIAWSNCEAWPLSWGEVQTVADWFCRMGKRYGLLAEFYENGLCLDSALKPGLFRAFLFANKRFFPVHLLATFPHSWRFRLKSNPSRR